MSEKRVAPPDGGSGDLVLIQRHLENLSAGEILEELDVRMEEMTDQSCDPELIRLYLDVLEEKEPLGLELDPEASLQRFLEERAGEESRSTPPEEPAAQAALETFTKEDLNMYEENTDYYYGTFDFEDTVIGRDYRALVGVYAERNGGGDLRSVYTNEVTAKR